MAQVRLLSTFVRTLLTIGTRNCSNKYVSLLSDNFIAVVFVVVMFFFRAMNDLKCSFREGVKDEVCASLDRAASIVPGMYRRGWNLVTNHAKKQQLLVVGVIGSISAKYTTKNKEQYTAEQRFGRCSVLCSPSCNCRYQFPTGLCGLR